jgi:rhomboid protease GluP
MGGAIAQKAGRVLGALWPADRPMVATLVGAAIVAIYAATILAARAAGTGSAVFGPSAAVLGHYGELDARAIAAGEWQRLITSAYLHLGLLHLGFNLMSLWTVAAFLEDQLGRAKTFALYTLLAVTGSLASYGHYALMSDGDGRSVGASGAVCGLIGVALGFALRRRNVARQHTGRYAMWAVWILVIAFSGWRIDNFGHAGGFVPGFFLGLVIRRQTDTTGPARTVWKLAALVSLLVTIAAFVVQARE